MIHIDDPDDPRIAAYRHIRERDLVGREGLFIAEGEVVLRHLIASARFETVSILLDEKRAAKLAPIVAYARPDAPLYIAGEAVIDAVAGFPLHRGILAVGRKPVDANAEILLESLPKDALILVLYGIGNHDNMGGLFRNAAAFGAAAILLDATCCDPLYRKAIRVSVGAALLVPFARFTGEADAIRVLENHRFEALALSPSGAETLSQVGPAHRTALILGTEGTGLPPEVLACCRTARIAMAPGFDSLNVAVTAGIALHYLRAAT